MNGFRNLSDNQTEIELHLVHITPCIRSTVLVTALRLLNARRPVCWHLSKGVRFGDARQHASDTERRRCTHPLASYCPNSIGILGMDSWTGHGQRHVVGLGQARDAYLLGSQLCEHREARYCSYMCCVCRNTTHERNLCYNGLYSWHRPRLR